MILNKLLSLIIPRFKKINNLKNNNINYFRKNCVKLVLKIFAKKYNKECCLYRKKEMNF